MRKLRVILNCFKHPGHVDFIHKLVYLFLKLDKSKTEKQNCALIEEEHKEKDFEVEIDEQGDINGYSIAVLLITIFKLLELLYLLIFSMILGLLKYF